MTATNALVWGAGAAASYLAGSVPFGWLAAKIVLGVDIRQHGSGNIGATNAARVLGWGWFPFLVALDALKGFAPVYWLAPWIAREFRCEA
jgi:glycerol-3-phosphate acyltransferase PlsY